MTRTSGRWILSAPVDVALVAIPFLLAPILALVPPMDRGPLLSARGESLAVAFLALPQIVHYILDGFLWKLDGKNPDLDRMLGIDRSPKISP